MNIPEQQFIISVLRKLKEITTWRTEMFLQPQEGTQECEELMKNVDEVLNFVRDKGYTNEQALHILTCTLGAALFNYSRKVLKEN